MKKNQSISSNDKKQSQRHKWIYPERNHLKLINRNSLNEAAIRGKYAIQKGIILLTGKTFIHNKRKILLKYKNEIVVNAKGP